MLPAEVAADAERQARFEREAKLLASLNHPNIATLHGLEWEGETGYLIMERVDGETLAERLERGRLGVEEGTSLFVQIAEGLEAAHARGIIYRDLKPANLKITADGRVKILDGCSPTLLCHSSQSQKPKLLDHEARKETT